MQYLLANLQCERRVQWRSIASNTHLLKGKLLILALQSSIWTPSRFVRHMMMLRWRGTDKMILRKGILWWRLNLLPATLRVLSDNCLNDFNMNQLHHSAGPYYWKSSTFLTSHCSICLMKEFTCRIHFQDCQVHSCIECVQEIIEVHNQLYETLQLLIFSSNQSWQWYLWIVYAPHSHRYWIRDLAKTCK